MNPAIVHYCGSFVAKHLRIAHEDYESSFEELLSKGGSVMIYQRNIRVLSVEMYKITYKLRPEFVKDMVEQINTKYHIRSSCNIDHNENSESVYTK